MDTPISELELASARRKKVLQGIAAVALVVIAFLFFRDLISPGVERDKIRTNLVERGDVRAAISASGVITPRDELVISAGFSSELLRTVVVAGAHVEKDDPILVLDSKILEVDIQDNEERLALKENERLSAGLKLQQSTNDSKGRYELRKIDLESRQAKYDRYQILAETGLISKGELHEAQLDVRRTTVEIRQLEEQMVNQQASNRAELERIALEAAILQNQLDEKRRLLDLTTVRAPRGGVLTWVLDEIGSSIVQGQPLVRIADLSAYRVEATLSDFYATQLSEGLPVSVEVSGRELKGAIQSVLPTVENGAMQLIIELDNPAADGLRPQLRVDVDVITGLSRDTLRLRKGLGISGSGRQPLYRVTGGRAIRTSVQLGLSNRDYIEIISGLDVGDEIIVSDDDEFKHLEELEIK
jgi:HlyD family secretion protein